MARKEGDADMTDQRIYELVSMFKSAMIATRDEGLFVDDDIFCSFPRGCCGPTCDLLATFLNDNLCMGRLWPPIPCMVGSKRRSG